jgi:hypothetical protein
MIIPIPNKPMIWMSKVVRLSSRRRKSRYQGIRNNGRISKPVRRLINPKMFNFFFDIVSSTLAISKLLQLEILRLYHRRIYKTPRQISINLGHFAMHPLTGCRDKRGDDSPQKNPGGEPGEIVTQELSDAGALA